MELLTRMYVRVSELHKRLTKGQTMTEYASFLRRSRWSCS
jgi:hypothetical protein